MVEDAPSNPIKPSEENAPPAAKNGVPGDHAHRYEVGPGFEIAVRSEGKHGVEVHVAKDADHDHKHTAVNRRLESLEHSVAELSKRLQAVESEVRIVRKPL